jgi:hypothetical protein
LAENEHTRFLLLVEDSNVEYDVLLPECRRGETEFIGLEVYRRIRERRVALDILYRRLGVLRMRKDIRIDNNDNIFPLQPNVNGRGRSLNDDDHAFALRLFERFRTVDAIDLNSVL